MYIKFNSLEIANNKVKLSVSSDLDLIKLYIDGTFIKNMTKNNSEFIVELDVFEKGSIILKDSAEAQVMNFLFINRVTETIDFDYELISTTFDKPYSTPKFSGIAIAPSITSVDKEQNYNQGFWDGYTLGYNIR